MTPFAIAGVQMWVSGTQSNVDRVLAKLDLLMSVYPWVQMVVFSELCSHGPLTRFAEPLPSATEDRYRAAAQHHGVWLLPGSLFEQRGEAIFNTAPVIGPDGGLVGRYSKMFPFMPYEEGVASGDFVRFSPTYRERTAMHAAGVLAGELRTEAYAERHRAWREQLESRGGSDEAWMEDGLLPDPATARVRVYATQSTHKTSTFRSARR